MSRRPSTLISAVLVTLVGILALPALGSAGSTQGATQTVRTFTRQADWFDGNDACTGLAIVGSGTESVTQYLTFTSNGGVHERDDIQGSVDLYQANGPGPWDPQPGAFVGAWTYRITISDQAPPDGQGSLTWLASGRFTFPDGSSAHRQVLFHITFQKVPEPPKLVFGKSICSAA